MAPPSSSSSYSMATALTATLIAATLLAIVPRSQQQQQEIPWHGSSSSAAAGNLIPPNPLDCVNDVQKVPDCLAQFNRTVSDIRDRPAGSPSAGSPSPACCGVVNGLADYCWQILYPEYYPALPMALKALCSLSAPVGK